MQRDMRTIKYLQQFGWVTICTGLRNGRWMWTRVCSKMSDSLLRSGVYWGTESASYEILLQHLKRNSPVCLIILYVMFKNKLTNGQLSSLSWLRKDREQLGTCLSVFLETLCCSRPTELIEVVSLIKGGGFYRLVKCNIRSLQALMHGFLEVIPLFKIAELDWSHFSEEMRKFTEVNGFLECVSA